MRTTIRKMGNSQGVIIPRPLLAEVGLEGEVTMTVEDHALVLRPIHRHPREGWAQASRRVADAGDDGLVWPSFDQSQDEQGRGGPEERQT